MSKLRDLARGQDCQVRIPGVCNFDPATTVLAHLTMAGISGRGLKAPDALGSWCCSSCHDVIDGRRQSPPFTENQKKLYFFEGMARTQYQLIKQGYIK
jgi:hypothetical protein